MIKKTTGAKKPGAEFDGRYFFGDVHVPAVPSVVD